ncbi:MAG: electron transfer flavoprotein subunit beta/FixA family protein [Syntrophales bacterium]
MNIVIAMKQVPDLQQVRIRDRRPVLDDVPLLMGDIDRSALAAAVALQDPAAGKKIVLSAGDGNLEDTVKEALAAGADEAVLVIDERLRDAESAFSARVLAEAIRRTGDVGLVLFGEGSADSYSGQVMSRVAGILGWPQAAYVREIRLENGKAVLTRSLEDREEILEMDLPAVASVVSEIAQPQTPSVTAILKAGRKPKTVWSLADLGLDGPQPRSVETLDQLAPQGERKNVVLKSMEELLEIIRSKEKP